jgi:hypothetical protein
MCSMVVNSSNSMIPSSPSRCSSSPSSLDSISFGICRGPQTCDPTFHNVIHTMLHSNEWYPPE